MSKKNWLYTLITLCCFIPTLLTYFAVSAVKADSIDQQRWQFNQAHAAIKNKNWPLLLQLSAPLKEYPLYYFLRYHYLRPQLSTLPTAELVTFLEQYGNTALTEELRTSFLEHLAAQQDWSTFAKLYQPQTSDTLQCHHLRALLATAGPNTTVLENIKEFWLNGKSLPNACDLPFNALHQSKLMNDELVLERMRLAFIHNNLTLLLSLKSYLTPSQQRWAAHWQNLYQNPLKTLQDFQEPDLPSSRDLIIQGISRLAEKQLDLAHNYWEQFQRRYAFSVEQLGQIQKTLALLSVQQQHPRTLHWLTAVHPEFVDEKLLEIRFKYAITRQHWPALEAFLEQLPPSQADNLGLRYWLARALEHNGKQDLARNLYQTLAQERDYYGFLAADRIKAPYQMRQKSTPLTAADQTQLLKHLSLAAAQEFRQLGLNLEAEKEWAYAIQQLSPSQQAQAAVLASRWGWHSQAITTASKAKSYDDLEIRFPLAYQSQITTGAQYQGLDTAWVYGIIRQESIFRDDARSKAGALGLMQLMPATARMMAKKLGFSLKNQSIIEASTNISLGTAYLRQMLDKFNGNYMLATAAYNAGPGRSQRWAEQNPCDPPDLWVEKIPFSETRTYVQRVLFYTVIYESRLNLTPRSLRLATPLPSGCPLPYSST